MGKMHSSQNYVSLIPSQIEKFHYFPLFSCISIETHESEVSQIKFAKFIGYIVQFAVHFLLLLCNREQLCIKQSGKSFFDTKYVENVEYLFFVRSPVFEKYHFENGCSQL